MLIKKENTASKILVTLDVDELNMLTGSVASSLEHKLVHVLWEKPGFIYILKKNEKESLAGFDGSS